jgi:phosphate transport system permease protein
MIFPTITTVSCGRHECISKDYHRAVPYGMGSTRWQVIYRVRDSRRDAGDFHRHHPRAFPPFGEALAVAMVIGKTRAFPRTCSLDEQLTAWP